MSSLSTVLIPFNGNVVTAIENNSTGNVFIGSFSDSNINALVTDYTDGGSITINWGDGSLPQILSSDNITITNEITSSYIAIQATHIYTSAGTYRIKIRAINSNSGTAYISSTAIIYPPTITINSSPELNGPILSTSQPIITFISTNSSSLANEFTAIIDYGDGKPTSIGNITVSEEIFSVTSNYTHVYSNVGTYTINVIININSPISYSTSYFFSNSIINSYCGVIGPLDINLFQNYINNKKHYSQLLVGSFIDQSNNNLTVDNYSATLTYKYYTNKKHAIYTKVYDGIITNIGNNLYNVYANINSKLKYSGNYTVILSITNNSGENPVVYTSMIN